MMRIVSPARRLRMVGEMNEAVKTLALSGLKSRYPNDPPEMIERRLADLLLGPELVRNVYSSFHSVRNPMLSEPIRVLRLNRLVFFKS
jgi:hypothetical protein